MEEVRYSTFGDQLVKAPKDIEECIIKDGTKTICSDAFWWREKLEHVTIPDTVTTIGEYNQEIKGKTNVEIIPVSA